MLHTYLGTFGSILSEAYSSETWDIDFGFAYCLLTRIVLASLTVAGRSTEGEGLSLTASPLPSAGFIN